MSIRSLAACFVLIAMCFTLPAWAAPNAKPSVEVVDAWAPPSLSQNVGIAYITLRNTTPHALVLTQVAAAEVARIAELHTHSVDARGVIRMRRLAQMELPENGVLTMQPGGHHVMLFDLKKPMRDGDSIGLRFTLKGEAPLVISVPVSTARLLAHIKSRNTSGQEN